MLLSASFFFLTILHQQLPVEAIIEYSRPKLLEKGENAHRQSSDKMDCIPTELLHNSKAFTFPSVQPKRRKERKQKQHKRGQQGTCYKQIHTDRLFPVSSSLAPEHSPTTDEMKLRIVSMKINSCMAIVTETWLGNNIPDAAIDLVGWSLLQADRTAASEEYRGGGLALYIHNAWFTADDIIGTYCSPDLEMQTI